MPALRRVMAVLGLGVGLLLLFTAPAGAVVGGQEDTTNVYENVGVWQIEVADGEWAGFCTGTLVAEDVVLTAAHCMDFFGGEGGVPLEDLRITFDPTPGPDSTYYYVSSIVVHPDWLTRPQLRGNSKRLGLAPPAEDIALVWLDTSPTLVEGIEPAPITDAGGLGELDLTAETFTVVGYGLQGFVKGSLMSHAPVVLDTGNRNYLDVSVITEHEAFADRFVKITASTCFGDSGGPLFLGETILAINTWTSSMRCSAPSFSYRLDAPAAQAFLDLYL
jgi:Trypsin